MFYSGLPSLDLHGEYSDSARILVKEFINDNLKLKKYNIVIIHGIGKGILKKCVHQELKKNKHVKSFKLDNFNVGTTIVELYQNIDNHDKMCYNTDQM